MLSPEIKAKAEELRKLADEQKVSLVTILYEQHVQHHPMSMISNVADYAISGFLREVAKQWEKRRKGR